MALARRARRLLVAAALPVVAAGCLFPYPVRVAVEVGAAADTFEHADLDGNGTDDLVIAAGCTISTRLAHHDATFTDGGQLAVGVEAPSARTGLATGDVDGDGDDDVVVAGSACTTEGHAAVLATSDGDGSLTAGPSLPLPGAVWGVALADLDEDGHLDLVVGAGTDVEVRPGTGTGAFEPPTSSSVGAGATALAVGDPSGDGLLDLVVAGHVDATRWITTLPGTGTGTFQAPVTMSVRRATYDLSLGDLDEDGDDDLVVTPRWTSEEPKGLTVHEATGGGAFAAPTHHTVWTETPFATAVGDVDGDGHLDVVAVAIGLGVLQGDGTGRLDDAVMWQAPWVSDTVRTADHDGDGDDDIAVLDDDHIATIASRGDGRLRAAHVGPDGDLESDFVLVGDVDGDGYPDLVLGDGVDGVTVMRNRGDGVVRRGSESPDAAVDEGSQLADLDDDGDLDLVGQGGIRWNDGSGSFTGPYDSRWGVDVVAGDLDGDGDLDLVAVENGRGATWVRINDGSGGFTDTELLDGGVRYPRLGDVDGDGDLDLVAARDSDHHVVLVPGVGTGELSVAEATVLVDERLDHLVVDDLDADGRADVAGAARGRVIVALSGKEEPISVLVDGMLEPADVDGDGDTDLVGVTDVAITVVRNRGDGTFGTPVATEDWGSEGFWDLTAGDLDGDGRDDVVMAGVEEDFLLLLAQ